MNHRLVRWVRGAVHAVLVLGVLATSMPSAASNWGARREYREGMREIARERREMRREIMRSGSRAEARREYREGMREIARERREARREIGRELHYGRWERERDRDRGNELFAGIVIGAVIAAAARGTPPAPPSPELCWVWADPRQISGWWDRCDRY